MPQVGKISTVCCALSMISASPLDSEIITFTFYRVMMILNDIMNDVVFQVTQKNILESIEISISFQHVRHYFIHHRFKSHLSLS